MATKAKVKKPCTCTNGKVITQKRVRYGKVETTEGYFVFPCMRCRGKS